MNVLNLYCGIGGNRAKWENVNVVAIDNNEKIANIYQDRFPEDKVIVTDAHKYLIEHYKEYDFIWTSPPCQTHSSIRQNLGVLGNGLEPKYPDMSLYQEIIFLKHNFKGNWVVENVIPYYKPLLPAQLIGRHYFWSNKDIRPLKFGKDNIHHACINELQSKHNFSLSKYKIENKRQILRNCVNSDLALWVFNEVNEILGYSKKNKGLFDI